jgi:hypothetical protein
MLVMKRLILIVILVLLVGVPAAALLILYNLPFDSHDPSPEQPIAFSHRLHAGEYSIDCRYCHRGVEISPVAGIPPMATCQSCHMYIANDRPEIIRLMQYIENKGPVEWVRVYNLPEHVYFNHAAHIRAGIDCSKCHDNVAAMDRIKRSVSLKMGWCLGCHRDNEASIDCWTCHI